MKTVILTNYIQGLGSFLDDMGIKWETLGAPRKDSIKIHFESEEQLFLMGFEFGKFYEKVK